MTLPGSHSNCIAKLGNSVFDKTMAVTLPGGSTDSAA